MKRILSLVLVLMLALCACASAEITYPESYPDGFFSTVQKIADGDVTLNIWIAVRDTDNLSDPDDTAIVQTLEQLTGVNTEWTVIKGSDWQTKTNLMFTVDERPDILIAVNGEGNIDYEEYGVTQGLVIPLDEYIDTDYMPNYAGRIAAETDDPTVSLKASDGHVYSIGYLVGQDICEEGHYFINTEWLNALGLEVPTTVDELTDVLRAFKEAYPDYVPYEMGLDAAGYYDLKYVLPMFGLPNSDRWIYIDEDAQVQFIPTDDNFRACLEWLHECYEEGLLDPECLSQDINTLQTKLSEGNVGFFSAWRIKAMGWDNGVLTQCECILPPAYDERGAYMDRYLELARGCCYITSNCQNPEAAVRFIDSMLDTDMQYSLYYGPYSADGTAIGGTGWTYNEDGQVVALSTGDQSEVHPFLDCNTAFFAPGNYISSTFKMPAQRIEKTGYCDWYEENGVIGTYSSQLFGMCGLDAETLSKFNLVENDIKNAVSEAAANFIANGVTDDSWNTFVAEFDSMGVDTYVETYQEAIDAMGLTK